MPCVYMITMPDGKKYIGVTSKSADQRMAKHIEDAKGGRNTSIAAALRSCKYKGVTISILVEDPNIELLYEVEKRHIEVYGTKIPDGHNATDGGRGFRGCIKKDIFGQYPTKGAIS